MNQSKWENDIEQERLRIYSDPDYLPEDMLRGLLATIHGDGGHHTENVGLAQSVIDAEKQIAEYKQTIDRLHNAVLCIEDIAIHQERLPKYLHTDTEKELESAITKIYRISHVSRKPSCWDAHEKWEEEFNEEVLKLTD